MEEKTVKISDLGPHSRSINIRVKVAELEEEKEIETYSGKKRLREAIVGDETGSVKMTLWEDQVDKVHEGDVMDIENGYISLYRGSMRLVTGRYGNLTVVKDENFPEVNLENNLSEKTYESRKPRGYRRSRYSRKRY